MITLAATAATDVVVAIGSNNTTTIATSPTTAEPIAATTTNTAATAEVTMIGGTTTNTPTSAIVANNTNRTNTMTTVTTTTTRPATIRRRHKVTEFNDLISCSLCSGYLINATTIDHCGDSFCRSCILQHMKTSKHCPKCGYKITLTNLGSDELLKALVYKLVPGLYHNEIQRQIQSTGSDGKDETVIIDSEDEYFSPVEPISLSLEYHPDSLSNFTKDQIPPVRYLQCPAAVTAHHLQRLISSKFNIDMDNARVDIEIIYEDKILSDDFSLMDVGYSYSWKRDTPLRLFYRILVHSECNNDDQVTNSDVSIVNKTEDKDEAIFVKPLQKEVPQSKVVHFKESKILLKKEEASKTTSSKQPAKKAPPIDYDDEDYDDDIIDDSYKNSKTTYAILKPKKIKGDDYHGSSHNNNNNNNSVSSKHKKDKHGQMDQPKESVKVTIIARKAGSEAKVKPSKNKTKRSSSPSSNKSLETSPSSDFKSLRSNDVRYMNDYTASLTPASTKQHKSKNGTKDNTKPTTPKCDIFVSIPPSGHRSSNSSDDSSENLSLAQLKTASKKSSSNSVQLKQSISLDDSLLSKTKPSTKQDVPKLKITVSKKSPGAKVRKLSIEDRPVEHVDLTTYAKHIGLKPINPPVEEKREIKLKISPGNSPSSSLSSSSASSPPSAAESGFVFNSEVSTSSHKKRKKAKHSKEPKEPGSKKRRLHAEISSPAAEESLKLKVKITGNPKSYKAERKASSSSDDVIITSPIVTIAPPMPTHAAVVSTTAATADKAKQKPLSPKPPMVNIPITSKLKPDMSSAKDVVMKPVADSAKPNDIKLTKESLPVKVPTPPLSVAVSKPASPKPTVTTCTISSSSTATSKLQPTKLQSIQDTKLPASPPLPPSLFKTAPMALQPLVLGPPKVAASPLTPKPRLQVRPADPARFKSTFAVPNSPRQPIPGSPKLSPISSIASAANRQAQLKRSASLDGNPTTYAKQQKIEQDKLIRKSGYVPFLNKIPKSPNSLPTGNGLATPQRNSPISISTISQPRHPESSYYTSPMTSTYTHEIQPKKQTFLSLPSSTISVTKMPDKCNIQSSAGLTITPQQQTPILQPPNHHQKPALEILRIQSSIPPIDQQKLPITNSHMAKPLASKTTRPPPSTIPLVKIKRSTSQVNTFKSTLTTVTAPIQQKAVLSMNNTPKSPPVEPTTSPKPVNGLHNKVEPKSVDGEPDALKSGSSPKGTNVCDTSGVLDLSGKSSRSPSQDKPSPPLTPISPSPSQSRSAQNLTLSSLEAALNKAKQQMSQKSPTSPASTATSAVNSSTMPASSLITTASDSSKHKLISSLSAISSIGLNSTNLQNLKMLSESATSREKIAIKSPKPLTAMPKLNEISKVRQPATTVRQQNASVRNIPNPSALTMRGQQVPMLTSISKISNTVASKTTTNSVSNTVASSLNGGDSKPVPLSPIVTIATSTTITSTPFTSSSIKPSSPGVSTTLTSSSDASKLLVSKKNLHLEQLAATLNMRAAAAAGETAAKSPASVIPSPTATPNSCSPPSSVSSSTVTTTATVIASPLVSSSPTVSSLSLAVSTTTPVLSSTAVSTTSSSTSVTTTSGVVSVTSSEPAISTAES